MPRSRTLVVTARPGHSCTRASNVSPSITRRTSAAYAPRIAAGSTARAGSAADRFAMTGTIIAPADMPRAKAPMTAIDCARIMDFVLGICTE